MTYSFAKCEAPTVSNSANDPLCQTIATSAHQYSPSLDEACASLKTQHQIGDFCSSSSLSGGLAGVGAAASGAESTADGLCVLKRIAHQAVSGHYLATHEIQILGAYVLGANSK